MASFDTTVLLLCDDLGPIIQNSRYDNYNDKICKIYFTRPGSKDEVTPVGPLRDCAPPIPDPPIHNDYEALCFSEDGGATIVRGFAVFQYDETGAYLGQMKVDPQGVVLGPTFVEVPCESAPPPSYIKDYERVCLTNDGGVTKVQGWAAFTTDQETAVTVQQLHLNDGTVATGYVQTDCTSPLFEKEFEKICLTNDGGITVVPGYKVFTTELSTAITVQTIELANGTLATGYVEVPCEVPVIPLVLASGGLSIADGVYAAPLGPDGSSVTLSASTLKSYTVMARRGTADDVTSPNIVTVVTTVGTHYVLEGETFSWSVSDDDNALAVNVQITANGDSAAAVTFVF